MAEEPEQAILDDSPPSEGFDTEVDQPETEPETPETEVWEPKPDEPKGNVPYDRFHSVVEERRALEEAAKAQGLVWDKASRSFQPAEPEVDPWDFDNQEQEQPRETLSNGWWDATPEQMVSDPEWRKVGEAYGIDMDTIAANEAALLKRQYMFDVRQSESYRQQFEMAETKAQAELREKVTALKEHPDFPQNPEAHQYVLAEIGKAVKSGHSRSAILESLDSLIGEAAWKYRDTLKTQWAAGKEQAEKRRELSLSAQASPRTTGADEVPEYSSSVLRMIKAMGMTPAEYAKSQKELEA